MPNPEPSGTCADVLTDYATTADLEAALATEGDLVAAYTPTEEGISDGR